LASYALERNVKQSNAVTTFVRLPPEKYATPEQRVAFHGQLRARLIAMPGMEAMTIASVAPFTNVGGRPLLAVDGQPVSDPPPGIATMIVDPAYFQAVGHGLVLGESFTELDGAPGHDTAIVNQRFADVYLASVIPARRATRPEPTAALRIE
jgi:hypothetical protein